MEVLPPYTNTNKNVTVSIESLIITTCEEQNINGVSGVVMGITKEVNH